MSSIFIRNPFGVVGDKVVVPMDATLSGTVSFEVGFGARYELDQKTDPDALAVPRDETNYILYALSLDTQQYQTLSAPDFITAVDNDGSPYSYEKGVKTRFEYSTGLFRFYESLKDTNIDDPSDPSSWRWVDNDAGKLTIDNAVFETGGSAVVDGDAVYWKQAGPFFSKAQALSTTVQNTVGIADVTNNRVLSAGVVVVAGPLTPGAVYYLSDATPGALTTTKPNAVAVRVGVALSTTHLLVNIVIESNTSKASVASVRLSADYPQVGAANTKVPFDTVESDSDGYWDAALGHEYFKLKNPGWYRVSCTASLHAVTCETLIKLYKNGSFYRQLSLISTGSDTEDIVMLGDDYVYTAGTTDTLEIYVDTDAGSININSGVLASRFQLQYLGA